MLVKCPKCKQEFDIEIELNLIENEEEIENKEVDIERAMEQLATTSRLP
jgi:hypothetical protein